MPIDEGTRTDFASTDVGGRRRGAIGARRVDRRRVASRRLVRAWDIQWSDDDRFIVVSGTEQSGRGHLVQLVDTDTGLITAVGFDDWVQSALLIRQRNPSPTVGGFEETTGCQPTIPALGFEVPGDREVTPGLVWYGTAELWTVLAGDGANEERLSVWWSSNFPGGSNEESPDISVAARRLDADVPDITSESLGTNASTPADGDFMIADFPARLPTGCWQVTGTYKGTSLSYVVDRALDISPWLEDPIVVDRPAVSTSGDPKSRSRATPR